MSRDVTYQSSRAPRPSKLSPKLTTGGWLLVGLVAINLGVFLYHGDPREQLPKEPAQETTKRAKKRVAVRSIDKDGKTVGWDGEALDPLLGLRMPGEVQKVMNVSLKSGQTMAHALILAGVQTQDVNGALHSLKDLVDFRRMRPGHLLKARLDAENRMVSLDVVRSAADQVRTELWADGWRAKSLAVEVTTVRGTVHGKVVSSLWEALTSAKEDPRLAMDIAEVFAWDIDFYSEVQSGDSFNVLVEKKYVGEKFIGYGQIVAAEYNLSGVPHRAFWHEEKAGDVITSGYYDENGESLKKQLLKSPLKYANVTSKFGSRKHPVLGYTRAHNGVDYGVPPGTPVWTVGDGKVTTAGWSGGFGKLVEVRHANGWSSQYAHLSAINVKVGQHVRQKDVVGLVGSTGLSSGPHLHYGLKKSSSYVDPLHQKFERAAPLAGEVLTRFKEGAQKSIMQLQKTSLASDLGQGVANEG